MKTEDRAYFPGRIETQPYTMERTSAHINPTNEEKEILEAKQNKEHGYAVEDDDHYAG